MRFPPIEIVPHAKNALGDLRDGLRYTWSHPVIRALIVLVTVISFFGFSFSVLIPLFARDVFHGDARTLGFLMSASGCGALCAALYLSIRSGVKGLSNAIVMGGLLLGVGLVCFSRATVLWFALPCMFSMGLGGVLLMASSNTVIQTVVDNQMRGRVMALFTMSFTGTAPLSNLVMGWIAQRIGGATVLAFTGSICVLSVWLFHRRLPSIRAAVHREREAAQAVVPSPPAEFGTAQIPR